MLSDDIKRANHRFETIVLENAVWNISQEARRMKADFLVSAFSHLRPLN